MFVTEEQMAVQIAKGERFKHDAAEWVKKNPATWDWMRSKAVEAAQMQRRFSIARLVEEARYTKPVEGIDEYKINHNIRRPLADMLVEAVPECAEFIERRSSVCDL